jgi:rhamnose utilization protein RhaD (predicted bifunctional aldolase and dehydrogenase)
MCREILHGVERMIEAETRAHYPDAGEALEGLVHYSRLLGSDESLVLGGGGNTSVKARGLDVAGRPLDVLFVKGSGSELKTSQPRDYTPLRLADLLVLETRSAMTDEEMVEYVGRCKLDPAAARPSIETLLHAFIPHAAVFHSHADAVLLLTNTRQPAAVVRAAFGDSVAIVPYQRPGFGLSCEVAAAVRALPGARGVILLNHGLVTWGDTPAAAYETHLELVAQALAHVRAAARTPVFPSDHAFSLKPEERRALAARIAPALRGALSRANRVVVSFDDADNTVRFVSSSQARQASAAGAATPDHILTTRTCRSGSTSLLIPPQKNFALLSSNRYSPIARITSAISNGGRRRSRSWKRHRE